MPLPRVYSEQPRVLAHEHDAFTKTIERSPAAKRAAYPLLAGCGDTQSLQIEQRRRLQKFFGADR
jgi:hypothetical protein